MSSAMKPALQPGAQASPGKAGASASQPPGARPAPLVGQNLVHHQPTSTHTNTAHVPMSPVSQNMAQMAQNMSHHGNLSHVGQNNGAAAIGASNGSPQPGKAATGAPLSLVQDKCPLGASQPLALTRPTDKKDEEPAPAQANGTVESNEHPSAAVDAHTAQGADKSKSEASVPAKSPTKPVEATSIKPADSSPAKVDRIPPVSSDKVPVTPKPDCSSSDKQLQVNKLGSSTDVADKTSPAKPKEGKEPPQDSAAAPTASSSSAEPKVPDESASAKTSNAQEPTSQAAVEKPDDSKPSKTDTDKAEAAQDPVKLANIKNDDKEATLAEEKTVKLELKTPVKDDQKSPQKKDDCKKEDIKLMLPITAASKKGEPKTPAAKSTLKLATVTPPVRKRRQESTPKVVDGVSSASKPMEGEEEATPDSRPSKRSRTKVQPYQSPTPELAMATKLSASAGRSTPTKPGDDKLIVFYKNEYLGVRNAEGGFYVCQTMQNVYRSSRKIKIRWLSQDKTLDPSGDTYKPDFYDTTDMECVLTTLSMTRSNAGGGAQVLSAAEAARARSILDRAISAEQTGTPANIEVTESHPDGLDLSLYTDESQLEKKKVSRKRKSETDKSSEDEASPKQDDAKPTPSKRAKRTPKKSPKMAKVEKTTPKTANNNNKRKTSQGTPVMNKTALAPEKVTPVKSPAKRSKSTPAQKTPAKPTKSEEAVKVATPAKLTPPSAKGKPSRKSDKESKTSQLVATPSTSTGKTTRSPRKPPSNKRRSNATNFILR